MPSIVINEKDYTIFNAYANNDNIVWIPGFAITGPYDEPVLLNSPLDLVNVFGDTAPATQYASGATSATYKMATGYDFAMQMLTKGFRVLFQRIVPYTIVPTIDGKKLVLDNEKIHFAGIELSDANFGTDTATAGARVGSMFKIKARDCGTYGNRLNVTFTMNVNQNKLYFKVTDISTDTVLEYREICSAKFKTTHYAGDYSSTETYAKDVVVKYTDGSSTKYYKCKAYGTRDVLPTVTASWEDLGTSYNTTTLNVIDPSYILGFAKGLINAIDGSDYVMLESGTKEVSGVTYTYLSSVGDINDYILAHINGLTGTLDKSESGDGTLSYTGDDWWNADFQFVGTKTIAVDNVETTVPDSKVNLFDAIIVNPDSTQTSTVVQNVRSSSNIGAGLIHGKTITNKEKVNVGTVSGDPGEETLVVTKTEVIVATDIVNGMDFTYNDAVNQDYITKLADTIKVKLDIISDTILYDVKFITLGGIAVPSTLRTDEGFGSTTIYSIMAGFCSARGDCVAILEPDYGEEATQVQKVFKSSESNIGGTSASYASAFAPWGAYNLYNGDTVWSAPSLIFLSALADSVSRGNPAYLPPAGVNRASLPDLVTTEYKIGSTILNMWQNKDRPDNINPIMSLNNYGYVIFGQRTLYDVSDTVVGMRSALQELGVRLAVIELKKKIKQVATGLLFEYNNIHTWNEFKAGMYPMLNTMVGNGAVQAYQIIMDGTTVSPDDIDNNVIRGTIRIIPGRAVEDFIITFELYRSGVTFTDEGGVE